MKELVDLLKNKKYTLSCAESLTGGLFASTMTEISGVSSVFKGGVVSYWNEIKAEVLHVPYNVIEKDGVVSSKCSYYMAKNVKDLYNSSVSVSFTGNAGPDFMENKPVGLVYITIFVNDNYKIYECNFTGSRNEIRKECIQFAKEKLIELIKNN